MASTRAPSLGVKLQSGSNYLPQVPAGCGGVETTGHPDWTLCRLQSRAGKEILRKFYNIQRLEKHLLIKSKSLGGTWNKEKALLGAISEYCENFPEISLTALLEPVLGAVETM